jgi:predicted molibdopterin-dependent oxidoreductase YjgC
VPAARTGATLRLTVDGAPVEARQGDTLMTAILLARPALRRFEFGPGTRAGFCLMGACQDCWVWGASGERLRACTTTVAPGLAIRTRPEPP